MQIKLLKGDITKLEVDAIVNAANTSLLGGGGVDGAIHRAGGKAILDECIQIRNRQGGCDVGEAVITTAGELPARFVIHTVGPRWNEGENQSQKLKNCYLNSLQLAEEYKLLSIAFPNISTGIYRYPKAAAAAIAIDAVRNATLVSLETVSFICFDEENYRLYEQLLGNIK